MSINNPLNESNVFQLIENFLTKQHKKIPIVVILGPTASGKTALSLQIAKRYHGEIVSADSRQIYRGLNIATDKISAETMEGIKHHLIDIVSPDKVFSAGDFKKRSEKIIPQICQRGKLPILVGGTGLYIDVLIQNFSLYSPQPRLRRLLEKELIETGTDALYAQLRNLDPKTAAKIHPHNRRHLLRGLEIVLATKKTKSGHKQTSLYDVLKIGISWPRDILYDRINQRVLRQIEQGLIEEAKNLLAQYDYWLPSMSSLGYPQVMQYLQGQISLDQMTALLQKQTRNYARRQLTWFRRDPDINWIDGRTLNL